MYVQVVSSKVSYLINHQYRNTPCVCVRAAIASFRTSAAILSPRQRRDDLLTFFDPLILALAAFATLALA